MYSIADNELITSSHGISDFYFRIVRGSEGSVSLKRTKYLDLFFLFVIFLRSAEDMDLQIF